MAFETKDEFVFNFVDQADYPAWTPEQTKQSMDARGEELRVVLNMALDILNSPDGANNIGATAPAGLTGGTIQEIFDSIKAQVDAVSLGDIPLGSLTDDYFSPRSIKLTSYVGTSNIGNAYSVSVPGITSLVDGFPICVKFNASSTNAITVNPNSLGAISVVDYFGNAVTNVRQNLIANLRYDAVNGNFQLQGKGGGGSATAPNVLEGKTATVDSGQITGTMPNHSGSNKIYTVLTVDQPIERGFTDGTITGAKVKGEANLVPANLRNGVIIAGVTGDALIPTGTATVGDIIAGKTATIASGVITGTLVLAGTATAGDIITGKTATIPSGVITGSLALTGSAVAGNVLAGKTVYITDPKVPVTGTMPSNGSQDATLTTNGQTKTIPAGYTTGGTVTASFSASATGTAVAAQVLTGYTFSNSSSTGIAGTMPNNGNQDATLTSNGAYKTIPAGYTSGGTVTASVTGVASGTAVAADVLTGHTFSNSTSTGISGTMPSNSSPTSSLTTQGATKVIATGYNPGGTVTANITNLIASNIISGATVGGIVGTALASGKQVAVVTASQAIINNGTYTASGLGFVPSQVIIFADVSMKGYESGYSASQPTLVAGVVLAKGSLLNLFSSTANKYSSTNDRWITVNTDFVSVTFGTTTNVTFSLNVVVGAYAILVSSSVTMTKAIFIE